MNGSSYTQTLCWMKKIVFATHVDGSCVSTVYIYVYVYVYIYGGAVTDETPCVLYSGVFNLNDLRI